VTLAAAKEDCFHEPVKTIKTVRISKFSRQRYDDITYIWWYESDVLVLVACSVTGNWFQSWGLASVNAHQPNLCCNAQDPEVTGSGRL